MSPRDAFADTLGAAPMSQPAPAVPNDFRPPSEGDDGLDIGEVSRVVKLADLVKQHDNKMRRTGSSASIPAGANALNRTGSVPKIVGGTVPVPLQDAVDVIPGTHIGPNGLVQPVADLPSDLVAPAVVAVHRRGLIALLIGATLLVGATVVVLVIMLGNNQQETGLGAEYDFNNQRPDEIVRRPGDPTPQIPDPPINPINPKWRPPPPRIIKQPDHPFEPPVLATNALKAEEIEQMAGKYATTTTTCFRRADKGADAILLQDIKKITVTLDVGADGAVTSVVLSQNGSDKLGRCLTTMVKSWKFRTSPGGTYRFVLAKPD
jgi:hypothetical protein